MYRHVYVYMCKCVDMDAAGIQSHAKSIRRIGKHDGTKRRPILAVVDSKTDRDSALDKGKDLKSHGN